MKRARRDDDPQPTSNRERVVALEAQIERLEELVNLHQRALDVQLQRIGEIQADLDAIRTAWTKTKDAPKRK